MQHPIHEIGDKRICPATGQRFGEAWDNPAIRPFTHWNVCDSCEPHSRDIGNTALNEWWESSRKLI